jgi:hypothetical protein
VITIMVAAIGVILLGLALAAFADRSARAAAWRQIALERRWNHEQRPDVGNHAKPEPP